MLGARVEEDRLEELVTDAAEFFQTYLWEAETAEPARETLAKHGLNDKTIRDFGVGYAPVGPDIYMTHLRRLGYSTEELVAAGLATRSPRGQAHAHFRSRLLFPVTDADGSVLGFAALGTHLGPSWALWVTSPDTRLYRRSRAVFGLDRAAARIAKTRKAVVKPDCIEVLKAHQDGQRNAVTVHSNTLTPEQIEALATRVPGGADALELDLPPGIDVEPDANAVPDRIEKRTREKEEAPPAPAHLTVKRLAIVIATALAAINAWTGAPLLAVWVGSQVQNGRLLSMRGVVSVVVVLALIELLLLLALTWLSATYDRLTGRPRIATETSPWRRAMRGDRVQDIRSRFGMSAPEKVVAACAVACVMVFEVWFFFFAGSPLGNG